MDQNHVVELWSRLLVGEKLSPAEEQELLDCLSAQTTLRDALLADESIDAMLRQLGRIRAPDDRFVEAVLQRTASHTRNAKSLETPVDLPTLRTHAPRIGRRKRRDRIWQAATFAACCVAAVVVVVLAYLSTTPDNNVANLPIPKRDVAHKKPLPVAPNLQPKLPAPEPIGLATLVHGTGARWKSPPDKDGRLVSGELELLEGQAEFHFDNGPVVRVSGPAVFDLRRSDQVFLKRGVLTAKIPHEAIGFSVLTPTSRVVDLGTEFQVDVTKSGATDTSVLQGKVSVEPQQEGKPSGEPIALEYGKFDRVKVWQPEVQAPMLPVFVSISGPEERFLGTITCNGSTAEFHSPQMFKSFETRTIKRLKESPERFGADWLVLTSSFSSTGQSSQVEINGKRMEFKKLEDALKPPDEILRHFGAVPPLLDSPNRASSTSKGAFHGVLIINGKQMEFHSEAEFDAARKKMLGAWMGF